MIKALIQISATLLGSAVLFISPLYAETIDLDEHSLFTRVESLSVSESVPIYGLLHELQGFNFTGDTAFSHNEVESGIKYQTDKNSWEMSVVKRYNSYLNYTTETAELLYLDKNEISVTNARDFKLDLRINQIEAEGIRLAYAKQVTPQLEVKLTGSWYQSSGLTDGKITGDLQVDTDNAISGSAAVMYFYDQDKLFDRSTDKVTGEGYAIDVQANWQPLPNISLHLSIDDVINKFDWDAAAYTQANLTSSIPTLDTNGYLQVSPVLSGIESYADYEQVLPKRFYSRIEYAVSNKWGVSASQHKIDQMKIHQVGAYYVFDNDHKVNFQLGDKTNPITISYANKFFAVAIGSDSTNYKKSHHFGLNTSLSIGF